jgi:phosphopantothenoylcysteine decarboxylase/phosphopantothenate--cysteine ligase
MGQILSLICQALTPQDLQGVEITISAGPTQEPLDPVRFLSNYSSGKMGYALAEQALLRGACVNLISGPSQLEPPHGANFTSVQTTLEMRDALKKAIKTSAVLIMAAAPSDFRPASTSDVKLKKTTPLNEIPLTSNPDILSSLTEERENCFTVGFAAESNNLLENATRKMKAKKLDMIVGNDITAPNAGFGGDQNTVTLLRPNEPPQSLPTMSKAEVANVILDTIASTFLRDAP